MNKVLWTIVCVHKKLFQFRKIREKKITQKIIKLQT